MSRTDEQVETPIKPGAPDFMAYQSDALGANRILDTLSQIQAQFITGHDQWSLWENFIRHLLDLTDSEFGYIGEVLYKDDGAPYLVFRGLTNIAWSPETRQLFEGLKTQGLEFHNMETLYGAGMKDNGKTVISNNPATDPRRGGLPPGHPPLLSFMGIPVYGYNGRLIAQIGLANRPGGFSEELENYLRPLIVNSSYIIEAYRNQRASQLAETKLQEQYSLMQLIMDNATAAMFMMDEQGTCTFMNPAAEKMTGYTLAEAQGRPLHDLIHHTRPDGTHYPLGDCPIDRALPERNQVRAHEDIFIRKDGTFFPVACSAEPIIQSGVPVGTVIEVRDLSEEKLAAQTIQETTQALREQLDLTRSITDYATAALFMLNEQGYCTFINPAAEKMLGYTWEEMQQKPMHDIIHHTHPDGTPYFRLDCPIDQALPSHTDVRNHESFFIRKDGTFFPAKCAARPILKGGAPVGTLVEVRDITLEKKAQQDLLESELRFRTMADSAPMMIWMTDTSNHTPYFNKTCLEFAGADIGKNPAALRALVHPDDWQNSLQTYRTAVEQGTSFSLEFRLRRHCDGLYRWLFCVGTPRHTANGKLTGFIGSCMDITERRQIREQLEELVTERTAQLIATNKELEAFCYSVSHDLRAPLRGIDGFSQALLEDYEPVLDDTGKQYLKQVRLESQKMGRLIEDMLRLSRVTRAELQKTNLNLSQIASEALSELQASEPERRVQLQVQDNIRVEGDVALLHLAMQNLLSNAWKFTSKTAEPRIEFGAKEEPTSHGEHTVYFVRDNGVGFDMTYADKLFGAFQRLHAMTEFPGTGVGLATVQRIIHRHGGEIWAEASPNQGAAFYFTLGDYSPISETSP